MAFLQPPQQAWARRHVTPRPGHPRQPRGSKSRRRLRLWLRKASHLKCNFAASADFSCVDAAAQFGLMGLHTGATPRIGKQTLVTNTVVPCPSPQVPYTKRLRKATLFMVAVSVCTPALRYRNRYLSESMQGSPTEPWFDRAEKSSSLPHRLF